MTKVSVIGSEGRIYIARAAWTAPPTTLSPALGTELDRSAPWAEPTSPAKCGQLTPYRLVHEKATPDRPAKRLKCSTGTPRWSVIAAEHFSWLARPEFSKYHACNSVVSSSWPVVGELHDVIAGKAAHLAITLMNPVRWRRPAGSISQSRIYAAAGVCSIRLMQGNVVQDSIGCLRRSKNKMFAR